MLKRLYISNYAVIDELELIPGAGLNIITGETGAGKSILLDSLSLVFGEKADQSMVRDANEKVIVEAVFDISPYSLKSFFEDNDLDFSAECILRRGVNANGKSRAFINDTPVTLKLLKELALSLVDVHRQFENPATTIVIPRVSSEHRAYIPMGFFTKESIVGDTCMSIPEGRVS